MTDTEKLIVENNQRHIQAQMDNKRQTQLDMIQGTRALAEQREKDLQALKDKQEQYKDIPPISEAEELAQLKEKAEREDASSELEALRKRFAKDGE